MSSGRITKSGSWRSGGGARTKRLVGVGNRHNIGMPRIAPKEGGHAARLRIFLVLEKNGEVAVGDISQDDGVVQDLPLKCYKNVVMLDSTTKDGGLSEANSAAGDSLWDLVPKHPAYMGG